MSNLFNIDLNPAFVTFLQTIASAQKQGLAQADLEDLRDEQLDTLNQQWGVLEQLALQGNEAAIPAALDALLREWAVKKACDVLLGNLGTPLDPSAQGLRHGFWQKLERKHAGLVAELAVVLARGREERAQAEARRNAQWEPFINQFVRDQYAQQQHWQRAAYDGIQQQHLAFRENQEIAYRWSNVAMDGVRQAQAGVSQAQQGAQQMYAFAGQVQSHAVEMLRATHQQQYAVVEEAMINVNRKRWVTRLGCACLLLLAVPVLLGICYLILTHLY